MTRSERGTMTSQTSTTTMSMNTNNRVKNALITSTGAGSVVSSAGGSSNERGGGQNRVNPGRKKVVITDSDLEDSDEEEEDLLEYVDIQYSLHFLSFFPHPLLCAYNTVSFFSFSLSSPYSLIDAWKKEVVNIYSD